VAVRCPAADPEAVQQAALVADELLANAITHGTAPAADGAVPTVTLSLSLCPGRRLRIAVRDQGRGRPLPVAGPLESEDGRGLLLVQAFAERWGTLPANGCAVVWAVVAL
jgi:two-component sensor histidine kinase